MVEHSELLSVVHELVSTSKETAGELQDVALQAKDGQVTMSALKVQAIAAQLRISANLIVGLLEENSQILDRLNETVERLNKK